MSLQASPLNWHPPAAHELLRWPLPYRKLANRYLVRGLALVARGRVLAVSGLQHVRPGLDPFILALNHNTRTEALLVPALIMLHLIHFLADWNFRLIPGIGLIYRRAETITVTAKHARPRVLDVGTRTRCSIAPASASRLAVRSVFSRKARSIAIRIGCSPAGAALRCCRWRRAYRSCRSASGSRAPSRTGPFATTT